MNLLSLVSLIFSVAMLVFGVYAISKFPNRRLNQVFFFFTLAGAVWAFTEFGYRQAVNAPFWLRGSFLWVFAFPLALHWVLHLSLEEKKIDRWYAYLLLYLPAVIFAVLNFLNPLYLKETFTFGWIIVRPEGVWWAIQDGWTALLLLLTIIMALRHNLRETDKKVKRQAIVVVAGVLLGAAAVLFDISRYYFDFISPDFPLTVTLTPLLVFSALRPIVCGQTSTPAFSAADRRQDRKASLW